MFERSREIRPNSRCSLVVLLLMGLLFGCAENPRKIPTGHIPYKPYQSYSCEELQQEMAIVEFKLKGLYLTLEKRYENDRTWGTWGNFVFPFNLLWLQGKGSVETHEYSRLLGMKDAIERVVMMKQCQWTNLK